MNNKWDRRFFDLAKHISTWSKDPSTQVGAVIAKNKKIISVGFNGFPQGVKDTKDRLNDRDLKYDLTIHAEINAIHFASELLHGCTLYTYPLFPCVSCAGQIIQVGMKRVVSIDMSDDLKKRWGDSITKTKEILNEAGVEYETVNIY